MPNVTLAVGLTGPFGSGSSTIASILRDRREFRSVRLSEFLERASASTTPQRADLQALGNKLRQENGPDHLAKLAVGELKGEPLVVFDGIRNLGELRYFREVFGQKFFLFAVDCPASQRWERLKPKYEAAGLTLEHFTRDNRADRDQEEIFGQQVQPCVDEADVLIVNDDEVTTAELQRRVESLLDVVSGAKPRFAKPIEILMNVAYSASHASKCLKRQVGAVIVRAEPGEMGEVVAQGFNENPVGTSPCVEEATYGYDEASGRRGRCFRDIVRADSFRSFSKAGVLCPKCGQKLDGVVADRPPWRCSSCKVNFEDYFWPERAMSWCTAIHAEVSALLTAGTRARDATLYTTTFPCFQCAEKVVQAGIATVVFTESYPDTKAGERLELGNVDVVRFEGIRSRRFHEIFSRARPYFEGS